MNTEIITTGEACRRLGIAIHRFCYLEQRGLIPPASRTSSGKRVFTQRDILRFRARLSALATKAQGQADV